jgi:3-dehydroquinate synthase
LSEIEIKSSQGSYKIEFSSFYVTNFDHAFFLVDSFFQGKIPVDPTRVVWVDANEGLKTLQTVEQILINLSEMGMTTTDSLAVIGGGCIQDLGTITASLYMRGVEWIYIPTTLAAMGDSCIGGKSSINAGPVKNLVGNFYPPKNVFIDPQWCSSLPSIEVLAGVSEIIKICFAKSFTSFTEAVQMANSQNLKNDAEILTKLITLSLSCKKYFIEEDEFDKGVRKLLNFGHSFGHAIEKTSNFAIPHGVAVMIGMIAATCHEDAAKTSESLLLKNICLQYLNEVRTEISEPLINLNITEFSDALKRDKKNSNQELVLVLPKDEGLELFRDLYVQGALVKASVAVGLAIGEILDEIR